MWSIVFSLERELCFKSDWKKSERGRPNMKQWKSTWKEGILYSVLFILFIGQIVLCFLSYNSAGLDVLVYIGLAMLAVGFFVFGGMARGAFQKKGGVPKGKHLIDTTALVDSGIYAVVRHPMYLSFIFYVIALIFISQHWLSAIFGFPIIAFFYLCMRWEEQANTEKFGDDYNRYMQRVPRANFLLGIVRLARRRRRGGD